jgi:predicted RNA binding protein YcfA (HicA-like mRNA interferase family)
MRALRKAGFDSARQTGSHAFMLNASTHATTVVPMHAGDLKPELLRTIIKQTASRPNNSLLSSATSSDLLLPFPRSCIRAPLLGLGRIDMTGHVSVGMPST